MLLSLCYLTVTDSYPFCHAYQELPHVRLVTSKLEYATDLIWSCSLAGKSIDIPQDIIDKVIAAVGDDTDLLKKCTLVSSSFLLPSRKELFSRVSLESDKFCQGIYKFLVKNPVIISFVRTISIKRKWNPKNTIWMNCGSLLAILRLPFSHLESFSINVWRESDWTWNSFSSELKDAFLNIIHSSSLKTLSLTGITKMPITFLHDTHLTILELDSISPNDFVEENSSSLALAASQGVAPISHTVIDRCVWSFWTKIEEYEIPFFSLFLTNSGQTRYYYP